MENSTYSCFCYVLPSNMYYGHGLVILYTGLNHAQNLRPLTFIFTFCSHRVCWLSKLLCRTTFFCGLIQSFLTVSVLQELYINMWFVYCHLTERQRERVKELIQSQTECWKLLIVSGQGQRETPFVAQMKYAQNSRGLTKIRAETCP